MHKMFIRLSTIEDIRNFSAAVIAFDYDIDLHSGRYLVDAKSIMGIFSLDLLNPIELVAHTDSPEALIEKHFGEVTFKTGPTSPEQYLAFRDDLNKAFTD